MKLFNELFCLKVSGKIQNSTVQSISRIFFPSRLVAGKPLSYEVWHIAHPPLCEQALYCPLLICFCNYSMVNVGCY